MKGENPGGEPGLSEDIDPEPAPNLAEDPEDRDVLESWWHVTDPATGEGYPPEMDLIAEIAELEAEPT